MGLEWYDVILIILAGFLAGAINTLAGSGSVVTISLLTFLGLPSTIANGTNRIGTFVQSLVANKKLVFDQKDKIPKNVVWQIVPSVAGAILGSFIAVELNEQLMDTIIGCLFIGLLIIVIFNPGAWLKEHSEVKGNPASFTSVLMFFLIGIYGGFIQAGVGIFLLSALVLFAGYNFLTANSIKLLIVLCFLIPSLVIFMLKDQIAWSYGLLMASGQVFGAYWASKFAIQNKMISVYVRYLLIVIIIISIIKFLKLYTFFV
ncbi:MAG: sulfite exporter TauE/SafE family protein [Chitinophagales bacterium]